MTNEEMIEQLEQAIELIKQDGKDWLDDRDIPILEACIKSLTALNKIRAEIVELTKCPYGTKCLGANCPSNTDCMICGDHVLGILDEYDDGVMHKVFTEDEVKRLVDEADEVGYRRGHKDAKNIIEADMRLYLEKLDLLIDNSAAYDLEVAKVQRLIRDRINILKEDKE